MTQWPMLKGCATLDQVHDFLLGVKPLDGVWFGEKCDRPAFWWRKFLRTAALASRDPEAAKLEEAELVRQWQGDRHEWFRRDIAEIVEDFAKWMIERDDFGAANTPEQQA